MLETPLVVITAESSWVNLIRALHTWIVQYLHIIFFKILQALSRCWGSLLDSNLRRQFLSDVLCWISPKHLGQKVYSSAILFQVLLQCLVGYIACVMEMFSVCIKSNQIVFITCAEYNSEMLTYKP
jgi:hypothetical protein